MSKRQRKNLKDSKEPQNELNERPSRKSLGKSSSRKKSVTNKVEPKKVTENKDEMDVSNDQTYEEILQRFYSQKQRMQECPEKGDVIRCTNSCITLEEEYCEVLPFDEDSNEISPSARGKERVMSTKICDEGCNYIKETVIEQTNLTADGLVIKTKHIIAKCGKNEESKNNNANKNCDAQAARKSRINNFESMEQARLRPSISRDRNRSKGPAANAETPENAKSNQRSTTFADCMPRGPCPEEICCQPRPATGNSSCFSSNQNEWNDECGRPPKVCCSCTSSKSNSCMNRREPLCDRAVQSSTKCDKESGEDKIDSISIQLFSSSASSRPTCRSRNQGSCECKDKCCTPPPAPQTEVSKLLAEIIIPNEYNCGVDPPVPNVPDDQGNIVLELFDDNQRTQNVEVQHKCVTTSSRREGPCRQRAHCSEENKFRLENMGCSDNDISNRRCSKHHLRVSYERSNTSVCNEDNDPLRRRPSRHHPNTRSCDEDGRYISPSDCDDCSQLDVATPPTCMASSKKGALQKCSTEDNVRQNSRARPMRTIMIPLVYVAPTQGCSHTCQCNENQPRIIQISGLQSTDPRALAPLSLQYRVVPDEEEDEDCDNTSKRKWQTERSNRRQCSGGEAPFPPFILEPLSLPYSKSRYSNDAFILYTSTSNRPKCLPKSRTSSLEREKESPSSDSIVDETSSLSSVECEEKTKSSSAEDSSTTCVLKGGEQPREISRTTAQGTRRSFLKNEASRYDRSSSKGSSCSDKVAAAIAKRKGTLKFCLLGEGTSIDGNACPNRPQGYCCVKTRRRKSDPECDSEPNDLKKNHGERPIPAKVSARKDLCPPDSFMKIDKSIQRRKRKSSGSDCEPSNRCNNMRKNATGCSKKCRNTCAGKNARSNMYGKGRDGTGDTVSTSESNESVNVFIKTETKEDVDYYRKERRDENNEVSFRQESVRKSIVNVTNITKTPAEAIDKDSSNQDESSDDTSSESNGSEDSSTECEDQNECCENDISEKCTQTDPSCTCLFTIPAPPCNEYCCFQTPTCTPAPMEYTCFQCNNQQAFCPCTGTCRAQNCCPPLPSENQAPSTENETKNNGESSSDDSSNQADTNNSSAGSPSDEGNGKTTTPNSCGCKANGQCECGKGICVSKEKCTQTEFSVEYCMEQPPNVNGFCCPPSCMHTSPPMTSQCIYECFDQQTYNTECYTMPPNDQPVYPCNMPYSPQYSYPTTAPNSNYQAPCLFPFQDPQSYCHQSYQQHVTQYCDPCNQTFSPSCRKSNP